MKHRYENFFTNARRYLDRYFVREMFAWLRFFRYYAVFMPLIVVALIFVFIYINPRVPSSAYLAIGQAGSSYGAIGEKLKAYFNEQGMNLQLIETEGLAQGLRQLDDPNSTVNASFMTAGVANAKDYPNLVSLGSFQYAPVWLFYTGSPVNVDDPFEYFAAKNISIGLPGTVSNKMFRNFLAANLKQINQDYKFSELTHVESARQLQEGKLDAFFVVDSVNSPVVKTLLKDPNIRIMSFNLAEAYVKLFPYLHKLTIPRGSLNLQQVLPREDITLVGSTTTLLVEKQTHRAIQWAFILALSEEGKFSESLFSSPGAFPAYMDLSFPLSPIAKRYYTQGIPVIFDYFPLWITSLIDHAWVLTIAFLALIYPMYKWLRGIRSYPSRMFLYRHIINLRDLDEDIGKIQTREDAERALQKLNALTHLNTRQWLSQSEVAYYFSLKAQMESMHQIIGEKLARMDAKDKEPRG